ncbi:MAG: transposase [Planctomycetes bacterium]|nr:transposase [Planctomycetota bacterium]
MRESTVPADTDGGWKQVIEDFAEEFFRFFFPEVHARIDFGREYSFLNQELAALFSGTRAGRRHVDKLIQVHWKNASPSPILLHVEVQAQRDAGFTRRMFDYNYRIGRRYNRPVLSLALLVDGCGNFRPDRYFQETMGCSTEFRFRTVKLIDFKSEEELLADANPFAVATLIQLRKLRAGRDMERRFNDKVALMRELYRRNYSRENVQRLFWFMDHILTLPEDLTERFRDEVEMIEEESNMPYLSIYERRAMEKGREEGREEGIEKGIRDGIVSAVHQALEVRFGDVPQALLERIERCETTEQLKMLHRQALSVASLDELQSWLDRGALT